MPGVDDFGNPEVNLEFNAKGAALFSSLTAANVGKPIAILLDKKIISAPNVKEPIPSGRARISGNFSVDEVQDLVIKLKAGALPVPVKIVETRVVGPTLGKDSMDKSKVAGIIGSILVMVFMASFYRVPGLVANLALVLYVIFVFGILALLGTTLTLPGIAGFLLSIGMAVDANVLIFERFKEEVRLGKTLRMAIDASFNRAMTAIVDSNVTTLISALILFWLGTGTIKGFAVTLSVGVLCSLITAVTITHLFMNLLVDWKFLKNTNTKAIAH
jgi:preprotein translocase subunit SecD